MPNNVVKFLCTHCKQEQGKNIQIYQVGEYQFPSGTSSIIFMISNWALNPGSQLDKCTDLYSVWRKKTQSTIRELIKNVEMQLTMRCLKHNILQSAPLMRCLLYKVQELNGERRQGDEKTFVRTLKAMSNEFEENSHLQRSNTYLANNITLGSRGSTRSSLLAENTNNSCSTRSASVSETSSESDNERLVYVQRSKTLLIPKVEC